MVDIEADGPIPGDYSIVCFGAVIVEAGLGRTSYAKLAPNSEKWVPEALAVSDFNREDILKFPDPASEMSRFEEWLRYDKGPTPSVATSIVPQRCPDVNSVLCPMRARRLRQPPEFEGGSCHKARSGPPLPIETICNALRRNATPALAFRRT